MRLTFGSTVWCIISVARNITHATLRWMCYDNDIDKYCTLYKVKCGPAVTTLSDVASPNAERTSSVLFTE